MTAELLHHPLARAAQRLGDRAAMLVDDGTVTFRELDERSNRAARHLADLGVGPGDRVAVMLTNRPEFSVIVNAVSKLGAASVLLSSAWKAREAGHALELTGARLAVADDPGATVLREVLGDAVVDLDDAGTLAALLDGDGGPLPEPDRTAADDALLVFSSGTTGMPKAVRHTHASLAAGTRHWVAGLGLGDGDRFQIATPPSHILGLLNLLAAFEAGATVRLHRRFDLEEVLRRIGEDGITLEMAVAPIALAMANHPSIEEYDLSSLRYIMWCATPVTESVAHRVTERTGIGFMQAYGASELPVIACNPPHEPERWRLDSAGLPPEEVELRVVDLDTGAVLPPGGIGEIQGRGPSVMAGYLPDEANAEGFQDGWYRTGDVGWLEPEGWVHLTDRSKEMIKVNGFQVAPAEIEAVLHGHPAVLDCAVFPVPDERAGELPVAAVLLDPDQPVADGELEQLVAESLATYKHLRHLVVVDAIPRLPSGKVLRRTLRDEWAPRLAADPGQGR
jgi:acyl-CoA synthetase (AMP-forming)/AMP-acid ligase II